MTLEHKEQLDELIGKYGVDHIVKAMADHLEGLPSSWFTNDRYAVLLQNVALLRNTATCILKKP